MDHERLLMRSCGALSARWKGQASYYNLVTNTRIAPKTAWSYLNPSAGLEPIAGGCCGRGRRRWPTSTG